MNSLESAPIKDNPNILPISRNIFRTFWTKNKSELYNEWYEIMNVNSKMGEPLYRLERKLINLFGSYIQRLNKFNNVEIPRDFATAYELIRSWESFYLKIITDSKIFADADAEILNDYVKNSNTLNFKEFEFPMEYLTIRKIHIEIFNIFKIILELEEVKNVFQKGENVEDNILPIPENIPPFDNEFDVAIITATQEFEFENVKKIIPGWSLIVPSDIRDNTTDYIMGNIKNSKNKDVRIVATSAIEMGLTSTTNLATKMMFLLKFKYLVMVGICAGIKNNELETGDIIVAREIWEYDKGKDKLIEDEDIKKKNFKPYYHHIPISPYIENKMQGIVKLKKYLSQIQSDWNKNNTFQFGNKLESHYGTFATGSAVVENSETVKEILGQDPNLLGFDMEAYGVYYTTHYAPDSGVIGLVMKSVCDYGDEDKPENKDLYQDYAAFTSAQYLKHLIEKELDF